MSKKLFVALALCLALLGGSNPSLTQADQNEDMLSELQRQGWKVVRDGVLQRELRAGEVETFVFGVGGFTWKVRDLQAQLRKLRAELQANPTPQLRKAIANHRKVIVSAQRALALAKSSEDLGEADLSKVSCTINFAYDAGASHKTDVQGVWSNASASFGANCGGFSGQVYAYAFAKAFVNGAETTETVTDGPRSGANASASAYASRNGGSPCESYSYGEMISYSLNPSSYSKSANNSSCPQTAPPLAVSVSVSPASSSSAPIHVYGYDCVSVTWTTNISGGTPSYTTTMYRDNYSIGNRTSYTEMICGHQYNFLQTITVRSDVVDSAGKTGSGSGTAFIQHHP
jgi:hypothetical protein